MNDPIPQAPDSVQETAADVFGDISNPAVESAILNPEATGSANEPVVPAADIPAVTDFKAPDGGTTHVDAPVSAPVAVVTPAATPAVTPPQVAQVPATPVQPTAEQIAQFQAWQAQLQPQNTVPFVANTPAAPVAQVPQQTRQLTQAEIDTAVNRYTVTPEVFNQLFSETDPAKATELFNSILEKKVVQAVTMANHLINEARSTIVGQVQPYMAFADSQRELMLREQFFQTNADLKGQDLLIQTVMAQMAQERQAGVYKPASEQQVFSDVAARTKALIAGMQQQGQAPAALVPGAQPVVQANGKPAMAVLPSGGGGGSQSASVSTAAAGQSQTAVAIFS